MRGRYVYRMQSNRTARGQLHRQKPLRSRWHRWHSRSCCYRIPIIAHRPRWILMPSCSANARDSSKATRSWGITLFEHGRFGKRPGQKMFLRRNAILGRGGGEYRVACGAGRRWMAADKRRVCSGTDDGPHTPVTVSTTAVTRARCEVEKRY